MAKPGSLPRWADVGGVILVPTSGKLDVGWVVERPPYQFFNWWMNLVYQWTLYLSAGAFTGGGSMAGGFAVTGGLASDTLAVSGSTSLAGVITDVTLLSGKHVTVQGTGKIKFGTQEMWVGASSFQTQAAVGLWATGAVPALTSNGWTFAAATGSGLVMEADLQLPIGSRIISLTYWYNKGGSATAFNMAPRTFLVQSGSVAESALATAVNDTTSGSSPTFNSFSGLNYTIPTATVVKLRFTAGASATFYGVQVTYDQP